MMKRTLILVIALLMIFAMIAHVSAVSVTRDLPDGQIDANTKFQVSISQTGFFVVGTVTEVLPSGYSYVDGSATGIDSADYDPATRKLELVIDSEISTVTYMVMASTDDGTFTGTYATIDESANPVTGDVAGDPTVFIDSKDDSNSAFGTADNAGITTSNAESTATATGDETDTDVTSDSTSVKPTSTADRTTQSMADEKKETPSISLLASLAIIGIMSLFMRKRV